MKKLLSLFLSVVLSLSLCSCGSQPIPAPDQTVDALLSAVLTDDLSKLQTLFGYQSPEQAAADLLDGQSLRQVILDSASQSMLNDDIPLSDETLKTLVDSILSAIGRCPIVCQTASMDENAGTAVVTVTINVYSTDNMEEELSSAMSGVLLANLDKLNDMQALYEQMFLVVAGYFDSLKPTDQTASFDVPCTLLEDEINGKTRKIWLPEDEEAMGEQVVASVFGE